MPDLLFSFSRSFAPLSLEDGLSLSLGLVEMVPKSSSGDVALVLDRAAVFLRPCSKEDRMRCLNVVCKDSGASRYAREWGEADDSIPREESVNGIGCDLRLVRCCEAIGKGLRKWGLEELDSASTAMHGPHVAPRSEQDPGM